MRHLRSLLSSLTLLGLCWIGLSAGAPGVPYLDVANVFTANQRINAGIGINIAPGATGTISSSAGIFERSRAAAMGDWTAVAFSAGNFTASTGNWTLTSGDQAAFAYHIEGHTLTVLCTFNTTSVSATPIVLQVAIPGGFTAKNAQVFPVMRVLDNGGSATIALAETLAGGTVIRFYKDLSAGANWSTSTDLTYVQGAVQFEVQ